MKIILSEDNFMKKEEVVNQIIKEIEGYINEEVGLDIYLVLECNGGELNEVIKLAWFINKIEKQDLAKIHLVGEARLQSGGVDLFLITNCTSKEILPFTGAMQHLSDRMALLGQSKQVDTEPYFAQQELDYINDRGIELLRLCGLSEDKIKKIEDGQDLWLTTDELISLVEESNKYENLIDLYYNKPVYKK